MDDRSVRRYGTQLARFIDASPLRLALRQPVGAILENNPAALENLKG